MQIEYNSTVNKKLITTSEMPSILIDFLQFQTIDSNWAIRLSNSYLNITLNCYDVNNFLVGKLTQRLTAVVNPYQLKPYILFNHFAIRFDVNRLFVDKSRCVKFEIEIELLGVTLSTDEKYIVGCHILEHNNYQLFCNDSTIGTVFITKNHPSFPNQKSVTLAPITVSRQGNDTNLQFQNHSNFIVPLATTDSQIINDFFINNQLQCSGTRSQIVL